MSLNDAISAFSAVTCWELSLIFLALYLRVSRRPENRVYSIITFFLGAMIWCKLILQHHVTRQECVFWYRIHYLCVYAIVAIFIHFQSLLTRQALPKPFTPKRVYVLMAIVSLAVFSPSVVHLAPAGTPPALIYSKTWGPLYPEYVAFVILLAFAAGGRALWTLHRRARLAGASPESADGAFSAFDRVAVWLIWSAAAGFAAGAVELVQQVWLHWINVSVNPRAVATALSSAVTAVALFREIRRTEDRRLQMKDERTRSEILAQARLQATYDMQHQIKNKLVCVELPLRNALRGLARGTPPEVQQSRLAAALAEVRDLFHALDVMLNVARLGAGEPVHLGPKRAADVGALAQAACRRRTETEEERRAGVFGEGGPTWTFECSVPTPPASAYLHADDLEHVLAVLLDNAVQYSPRGGMVSIHVWIERERLRVSVADQGVGIAPEDVAKIGRRAFFRGEVIGRQIAGTGLGLYLARRLVEAQDGEIWAESILGEGSTFHVSLPLEAAYPSAQQER